MEPPRLLTAARERGLRLAADTLKTDESGLDFLVAFATDHEGVSWVLRAPRRSDVLDLAARESRVLGLVRPRLPVAVPEWRVNTPELIAYPKLPGTPVGTIDPEAKAYTWHLDPTVLPSVFVDSLADAMAALHGIDLGAVAKAGVRVRSSNEVRADLAEQMATVRREWRVSESLWRRWQSWLADATTWPDHSALIHGDLHAGHILVDEAGRVTGFLDWTEAEVGDPATDFTLYPATFGEPALDTLIARYETFGGRTWPRMRQHITERLAAYPVAVAMYALRTGSDAHAEYARAALDAAAQS